MSYKIAGVLRKLPKATRATLLITPVLVAGIAFRGWPEARAEVEKVNPPAHFLSGDERSEILLKEMLTVLKRIDQRLERLERSAGIKDETPADNSNQRRGGRR